MTSFATETVAGRIAGERPGRLRAFAVACIAGVAAGALTYKVLRSGADDGH
jgi:hypothetical protein